MYGRATRLQIPPASIDKGIALFKETVLPNARSTPGNAGGVLLVDRKAGSAIGITFWETTQALNASEQFGVSSRTQSVAQTGGSIIDVERFEQVLADRAQPPKAGSFVRLNTVSGTPEKLDDVVKFMQKQVLPLLQSQKGYRAALM